MDHAIVLFDGYCNLCNGSVNFLITHDKHKKLRYAALQSEVGQKIKSHLPIPDETDSIILIHNHVVWLESDAVLKTCQLLPYPYKAFGMLTAIPASWRNHLYRWIAKSRYKWFGKQENCRVPDEEVKGLFLEDVDLKF